MRCKIPANDLQARLDNTFCMYKGDPVYVRVDGSSLGLYDPEKTKMFLHNIYADDPEFDISTPPLGYAQYAPRVVVYVTREPRRKYKQGFDSSVMSAVILGGEYHYDINLASKYMKATMSRLFPPMHEVLKKMRAEKAEMLQEGRHYSNIAVGGAVSNDCAFRLVLPTPDIEVIEVWFKQQLVGTLYEPLPGLGKRFTVAVPSRANGWIVSAYLREFDWIVE